MFETNHLVIVGGPSAVGKSTLLKSMRQRSKPLLLGHSSIFNPSSYLYLDADELSEVRGPLVDRLVLHYDFIHQFSKEYGFQYLSGLIARSNSACILTLCAPASILYQRISSRLERVESCSPNKVIKIDRLKKKKEMYKDKSNILDAYDRWLIFTEECGVANNVIINSVNTYQITCHSDRTEAKAIIKNTLFEI